MSNPHRARYADVATTRYRLVLILTHLIIDCLEQMAKKVDLKSQGICI